MPWALAPDSVPVDTDPLHCFSSPRVSHPSRVADGSSPALLARLFGNNKDCRPRGASPEGAGRVEYRCAAIGHPKVLPGRLGGDVRGSGPGRVRGLRPGCGWRRRACPGRGSRTFDRVERHYQVAGDALVGPARGEQPQHRQFAAGQRLGQARRRYGACLAAWRARARLTAQPRGSPAAPAPPVTASRLSQPGRR